MSRELRRQCGTIDLPGPITRSYSFRDASRVAAEQRPLMDAMNYIIAIHWQATEPHWTADSFLFDGKFSWTLVCEGSGLVAFWIYRKLRAADRRAICRTGTEVLPGHQDRGRYGFFTAEVLKSSGGYGALIGILPLISLPGIAGPLLMRSKLIVRLPDCAEKNRHVAIVSTGQTHCQSRLQLK